MKSIPASSSRRPSCSLFSEVAAQRSGNFVTVMPPEQFDANVPSTKSSVCRILRIVFLLSLRRKHPDQEPPRASKKTRQPMSRETSAPHYWHLAEDSIGVAMTDLEY